MTTNWKRLAALCLGVALSIAFAPTAGAQDAPKDSETAEGDIEFDEQAPDEENADDETGSESVAKALERAVESEVSDAAKDNSPEDLLNLATELKLSATSLVDLTKVVSLCNKAEKLGLDDDNREFAKQLRISAQLDRGLAVAQIFMDPDLALEQLPRGWEGLRDNAIGDFNAALAEYSDVPIAQLSLGRLLMLADKKEEAKKAFDAAINSEDASADADAKALALMFRAMLEDDASTAAPFLEKAIALVPKGNPKLYAQYSAYLEMSSRLDEALKQIDKAIELAPDDPEFKKLKAGLLVKARRTDEAKRLFEEATKDSEDNLLVQIEKGQFLASTNDYQGALDVYSKLAEKYDGPGIYFLRGAVYAQMKEYAKAIADANQALKRDSDMLQALRLKGIVYLQMEKYDDAARTFGLLKRKSKSDAEKLEATTQIAFALSKKGLYKRASEMLKKELEKEGASENVELLRSLADMELLFGHWEEAARLYDRLLAVVPKDSGVLNNYAWLLATCPEEQYRDGKRALEYAKASAEETFYAAPHILSTLASAYAEIGDFESATSWSQKAVELGEIEEHESLDSLKKELESYKENKPWRETSEIQEEVEESEPEKAKPEEATSNENNGDAAQDGDEKSE